MMGAKIGPSCLILPGFKVLIPWNLILEDHVAIGRKVEVYNHAMVRIDRMTVISQYSMLCTSSHDYSDITMPLTYRPIKVGSECWIAADAFVGPGVNVGNGAVVGARAVVTRDVAPWTVVIGNPAKFLRSREILVQSDDQTSLGARTGHGTESTRTR
jgi:putative colanic acid biosynthesis acetyltransferase WcaF